MDYLIAEKVMGYSDIRKVRCERCGVSEPEYHYHLPNPVDPHNEPELRPTLCIPKYSTEISAAWEVMNQMYQSTGFQEITIRRFSEGDGWEVIVGRVGSPVAVGSSPGSEVEWEGVATCAPLAICRAALKAVGVEV